MATGAAARILVVEDDASHRSLLGHVLRAEGYEVAEAAVEPEAITINARFRPDVVLLDRRLPDGIDGLDLARRLVSQGPVGVILVTGMDEVAERVAGLGTADDYITKPFEPSELLARVRALLRRAGRAPSVWEVDALVVDEASQRVTWEGRKVPLTPIQFDLLVELAREQGAVVSREHLLARVWDYRLSKANVLHTHMSELRKKLEEHGALALIHTVRASGYVLRPQTEPPERDEP